MVYELPGRIRQWWKLAAEAGRTGGPGSNGTHVEAIDTDLLRILRDSGASVAAISPSTGT